MTKREMNLRIFQKKDVPWPLFQPRIESWYAWHRQFSIMPERYKDYTLLDLYDDLDISMRYVAYYTGVPSPIDVEYSHNVRIKDAKKNEEEIVTVIETPYGELVRELRLTSDMNWRTSRPPIKNREDIKKAIWLFRNTTYHFLEDRFEQGIRFIEDRGEPQFFLPRSPYQSLHVDSSLMNLEGLIYAIEDYKQDIEELMKVIDDSYDSLYEEIIDHKDKVRIVNFGENIDAYLLSPKYFEEYLIPFYEKRSNQLRNNGIYTHIHIDGHFRPILRYLRDLPFDGLEALTPLPQGDVSLEEIKEAIGDKILLDGIPAILFLPTYSQEELYHCVEKIIKLFYPNLILGISDEIPEGVDEEAIERVRWISRYCKSFYRGE
ncbi:MAG: uroporphyrinogen decarboxylase family protein [bacterium]